MRTELLVIISLTVARAAIGSTADTWRELTLPPVIVEIVRQEMTKTERAPVSITVAGGQTAIRSKAEMHIRGSSSATYSKKPYRLELQDDNGDDSKLALLGMPKESDWILFPAYTDKTMIRDVLAYELWRQMGYWAPRTRYVELYIRRNGTEAEPQRHGGAEAENEDFGKVQRPTFDTQRSTNGYEGVYVLMENIKRGKERLNVAKLSRGDNSEPKITGG